MSQAIGGYFELELSNKGGFLHDDGVLLNTGRNALEYILRSLPHVRHIWMPYYTCEVVYEPVPKLSIPFSQYHIDQNLEIEDSIELNEGDYLLYTNYFGIKDRYVEYLANRYGKNLIVDNAQAWYSSPIPGISTIYSPRKYVGVPDGGIAYCENGIDVNQYEQDYSFMRCSHLLKRLDTDAENGYADFKENNRSLAHQPIRRMSSLTKRMLSSIDFDLIKERRIANYSYLASLLNDDNRFELPDLNSFQCPMVYPFLSKDGSLRDRLIAQKLYVATYWPQIVCHNNLSDAEKDWASMIIPVTIDQRYHFEDLTRFITEIRNDIS